MVVSRGECIMSQAKSLVTIKGTKDGLTFLLDDRCSFDQLVEELKEKLSSNYYKGEKNDPFVFVKIDLGNRYLTQTDQKKLEEVITEGSPLRIEQYESAVVTLEEAQAMKEHAQTTTLTRMIRSGQVVHIKGNVLLVGDINPGGLLTATGSIYVMGALKGKAHAGYEGNCDTLICASAMMPTSLHIADQWIHFADEIHEDVQMQAAFVDNENEGIRLEKVQRLLDVGIKEAVS